MLAGAVSRFDRGSWAGVNAKQLEFYSLGLRAGAATTA